MKTVAGGGSRGQSYSDRNDLQVGAGATASLKSKGNFEERPHRVQRQRTRGWRMPPNTVYVGRTGSGGRGHGKWGNPRRAGQLKNYTAADAVRDYRHWLDRDPVVRSFENVYGKPPTCEEIRAELRGKNLACWCKLSDPCHADVLLELANAPRPSPRAGGRA